MSKTSTTDWPTEFIPKVEIGARYLGYKWDGIEWTRIELPWHRRWWGITLIGIGSAAAIGWALSQIPTLPPARTSSMHSSSEPPPPASAQEESSLVRRNRVEAERAQRIAAENGIHYGGYPKDQKEFVAHINTYRELIDGLDDGVKEAAAIRERDTDLLKHVGKDREVIGWVGTVFDKGLTRNGKAYLSLEIAPGARVQTWSNQIQDINGNTLIPPDSPVFAQFEEVNVGDNVVFSAEFQKGEDTDLEQGNWLERYYGFDPEFIVEFRSVVRQVFAKGD